MEWGRRKKAVHRGKTGTCDLTGNEAATIYGYLKPRQQARGFKIPLIARGWEACVGIFLFWLIFSIVIGIGAGARGRNGFGWFLLSVVISPLLALIALLLVGSAKPAAPVTVVVNQPQ